MQEEIGSYKPKVRHSTCCLGSEIQWAHGTLLHVSRFQTHDDLGHCNEDDARSKALAHNGGLGLCMGCHSGHDRTNTHSLPGSLRVRDDPCTCDDDRNLSQIDPRTCDDDRNLSQIDPRMCSDDRNLSQILNAHRL